MKETVFYNEQPSELLYMRPNGAAVASVWLRKNIREIVVEADGDMPQYTQWEAEEVYLETAATEAEIAAEFDHYYEHGTAWEPRGPEAKPASLEEQVVMLREENRFLTQCIIEMSEVVYNA